MPDLDASATLTLHRTCPACGATGSTPSPGRFHCTACLGGYGEAERLAAGGVQPCGHVTNHQRQGARCTACHGRGAWHETVTLAELAGWIEQRQGARQGADVRGIVAAEVKRLVPPRVAAGKKGPK